MKCFLCKSGWGYITHISRSWPITRRRPKTRRRRFATVVSYAEPDRAAPALVAGQASGTWTRRTLPADPAFPEASASVGRWRAKTPGVHREGVPGAALVSSCPGGGKRTVYVKYVVRTGYVACALAVAGFVLRAPSAAATKTDCRGQRIPSFGTESGIHGDKGSPYCSRGSSLSRRRSTSSRDSLMSAETI